jgi:predicted nucleic acid-binding protein
MRVFSPEQESTPEVVALLSTSWFETLWLRRYLQIQVRALSQCLLWPIGLGENRKMAQCPEKRQTTVARTFIDTNIFFYAIDSRDPKKQARARALISEAARAGEGVVSAQVVQEFANNAMKKLYFTPEETATLCAAFADHTLVKPDLGLITNALNLMKSASLSFWDACIIAAAEQAQCKVLFTEDLNPGQQIGGMKVVNPFI